MERRPDILRDEHGVRHVCAGDEAGMYWGLGWCHATDRLLQMLLMRLAGAGRISQFLQASDKTLAMDKFFRRMNWTSGGDTLPAGLPDRTRRLCEAYCEGVNSVLERGVPWEMKLAGYRAAPWTIGDSLLLGRMIGYVSLAQTQADVERFMVEMIQAGIRRELIEEIFPNALAGADEQLLHRLKLTQRVVPAEVVWGQAIPAAMASNNWVIAGSRTASGKPMLANDPHMAIDRLPGVWYEVALACAGRYLMGATVPGLPAVILGRTPDVAWGVTYSFMDTVDSWVEHCRDGKYQRGDAWVPFRQRREIIERKGAEPVEVVFYENEHGVLDGDPSEEGYYLATRWSGAESGVASIVSFCDMWGARDVHEGMRLLGGVETAWNWVLADRAGNIGYQMSGLMPRRREGINGAAPLAGWDADNDWRGFVPADELPRCVNPAEGFFVTANQDLNAYGKAAPISVASTSCRADRIRGLLGEERRWTVEDMARIQYDVYSPQAEAFMKLLRPVLPDTAQGRVLREWDCRYDVASKGAFLFERFYRALVVEVFGRLMGMKVIDHVMNRTSLLAAYYSSFDRVLLSEDSAWFGGEGREEIYRRVAQRALAVAAYPWGEANRLEIRNMFFDGRLPRFFGFDRGPIEVSGGRATVLQMQILRAGRLATAIGPSVRIIADMAEDELHSNVFGGGSDRRFSRWYASELKGWAKGGYKRIKADRGCTGAP